MKNTETSISRAGREMVRCIASRATVAGSACEVPSTGAGSDLPRCARLITRRRLRESAGAVTTTGSVSTIWKLAAFQVSIDPEVICKYVRELAEPLASLL